MTSKISYIKLILENIRQRSYLALLTCIGFFLLMPVYTMMYLDSNLRASGTNLPSAAKQLKAGFSGLLNGAAFFPLQTVILLLGVILAVTGFSFIHSREKIDFYHSFPVYRRQWFLVSYLSGLIIFLFPYVVCSLLTILTGSINGVTDSSLCVSYILAVIHGVLAFLLAYHTCILAMLLTGTNVVALLASIVLFVYLSLLLTIFPSLGITFFQTCTDNAFTSMYSVAGLLSPGTLFLKLTGTVPSSGNLYSSMYAAAILLAVLLIIAAFLLYRKYPSEAAGNPLAFPVAAPVIKLMTCVPVSLAIGLYVKSFTGVSGKRWIFIISIIASLLLSLIIDFIYSKGLGRVLRYWRSSLLSLAGVAAILCFFQFDLIGYDTYLPDSKEIAGIQFEPDTFISYFEYPEQYIENADITEYLPALTEEEAGLILPLAIQGIDNLEAGITPDKVDFETDPQSIASEYINTAFYYTLANGRTISRRYSVKQSDLLDALVKLCEDDDYRRELFPAFHLDLDSVRSVHVMDICGIEERLDLTDEQREQLLSAYQQDILAVDLNTLQTEAPIGEFYFYIRRDSGQTLSDPLSAPFYSDYAVDGEWPISCFYIYKDYKNTLSVLEKYGYTLKTKIAPEAVSSISFSLSDSAAKNSRFAPLTEALSCVKDSAPSDYGYDLEITATQEQDIRLLLDHISYMCAGIANGRSYTDYLIADITYTNGYSNIGYYLTP